MINDEDEDQDALAAEYVIGTLDADERAQAQALMSVDAGFASLVRQWERRLGELQAMVDPIEPPATSWETIKNRIDTVAPTGEARPAEAPPPAATAPAVEATGAVPSGEVIDLSRRLKVWRGATAGLAALAATLVLFVAAQEFAPNLLPAALRLAPTSRLVAVLQRDETAPAFLVTVDTGTRTLTVRRVAAGIEPGYSYELWLVSPRLGAPRSLGVISNTEFTQRPLQASYDANTITTATYAVSLEPEGGSRTGAPTGPVLWTGRLVEATPKN